MNWFVNRTKAALGHPGPASLVSRSTRIGTLAALSLMQRKRISFLGDVITDVRGQAMNGTIVSVENHGSIVVVWLDLQDGTSEPVYMDHGAFGWMIEGESCGSDDLLGREVCLGGQTIEFLDNVEVA
jgi:hypothetical protein